MREFRAALVAVSALLAAIAFAGCTPEMKARAYASGDRDEWQQPERVIERLAIEPGQSVADLGAGGGYFTFFLAGAVGREGRVYAVDVDSEMNERLEKLARDASVPQVSVVLADFDDPKIPEPVDLIFTSNTYHHIENRVEYFRNAARYLRPGGRLAVLEYKREGFFQRFLGHATDGDVIRSELEAAGYTLVSAPDFVERQHFLILERPEQAGSKRL